MPHFQVTIFFASGHDCQQTTFEDVSAKDDTEAHIWAYKVAQQIGIPVASVLVYPQENRQNIRYTKPQR